MRLFPVNVRNSVNIQNLNLSRIWYNRQLVWRQWLCIESNSLCEANLCLMNLSSYSSPTRDIKTKGWIKRVLLCLPPINRLQHLVVTLYFKHMMLAWFFSVFPFSDCQVWSGDTAELPKLIHFSSLSHVCVTWCHQRFIKWNEMQLLAVDLRAFKFLLPRVRGRCGSEAG